MEKFGEFGPEALEDAYSRLEDKTGTVGQSYAEALRILRLRKEFKDLFAKSPEVLGDLEKYLEMTGVFLETWILSCY